MQSSGPVETDIVLLGGGHAHVEVLRRFALRPEPGVRLTLIGREPETPYSGMLPGLIRGDYTHQDAHIDLAPLAAMANARLIMAEATAFDPEQRTVTIPNRPDIDFDLLSVDVGGLPAWRRSAPGSGLNRSAASCTGCIGWRRTCPPVTGSRSSAAVRAASNSPWPWPRDSPGSFAWCWFPRRPNRSPLPPRRFARAVRHALVDAGVELICGVAATALDTGRLLLSDGSFIHVATALWATGVEGPPFLAASGIACDDAGCIRVTNDLRSISHPHIFAAGDCAALEGDPRPKAGVWAVRAGAPLAENLRRAAKGRALRPWRPQRDALAILGLGHGRAVAWRNGIALQGRKIWWLKDRIDRRWMRMYTEMRMPARSGRPDALRRLRRQGKRGGAGRRARLPAPRGQPGFAAERWTTRRC